MALAQDMRRVATAADAAAAGRTLLQLQAIGKFLSGGLFATSNAWVLAHANPAKVAKAAREAARRGAG
jgi:hypothetical protein